MAETIRVGLVGASAAGASWSSIAHVPALRAADGIELAAVCTSRPESARAASDVYGVPGFHDVRDLAAREDIDLVSVVVRVPRHREVVMAALDGHKHVFSEWPLGSSLPDAEQMTARATEAGVATAVGLQGRHDPRLTHIRNLHADGWLGRVVAVNVTMFGGGGPDHSSSEAWMGDATNGANFFTIVGGHVIDTLEFCVGPLTDFHGTATTHFPEWRLTDTEETVAVDSPDSVVAHGTLEEGATVSVHAAGVPHNAIGWVMRVHGTEGTIVASTAGLPQITPIELLGSRGADPLEVIPLPPSLEDHMPEGPAGNVGRAYQHLARAIGQGTAFTPDFAHAERLHRLIGALGG